MKRRRPWILFVVLLLIPIACLAEWLFTDCWLLRCAPVRTFSVLELDIPAAFFPEPEYSSSFTAMHESSGSLEDGIKTSYWDNGNGLSVYIVERFFDSDEVLRRLAGVQSRLQKDYSNSVNLSIESIYAQNILSWCGFQRYSGYRCEFAARYDEYYVLFNAIIDEKMTEDAFIQIVEFVDSMFVQKLSSQ